QAEDGIRDRNVTGVQTCALPICLTSDVSAAFTVNPGPAAGLAIQTQPPTTVTAGTVFSPAPVIRVVDAFGNLRSSDSSTVITAKIGRASWREREESADGRGEVYV